MYDAPGCSRRFGEGSSKFVISAATTSGTAMVAAFTGGSGFFFADAHAGVSDTRIAVRTSQVRMNPSSLRSDSGAGLPTRHPFARMHRTSGMRAGVLALVSFLVTAPLRAHDFWIEPSTFRPAPGQNVSVALRVGEHFLGDPVPRSGQLFETFTVRDTAGERDVIGFEKQEPAGVFHVGGQGLSIIGYRSRSYPLELPAAKFEEFLRKENLERISSLQASRGESNKPDRRCFTVTR